MQLLAQRAEAHGNAAAMMVCSNLFFWEFEKLLLRKIVSDLRVLI